MSLFGAARQQGPRPLASFKVGKMSLQGSTLTAQKRRGEMSLLMSDDGLLHFSWRDVNSGATEDDLIIFPQEAELKRIAACKDAYAMVLEFNSSTRKLFFWSQELRKKGADLSKPEDVAAEDALLAKFNETINNPSAAAAAGGGGAGGGGAGAAADPSTIGGLSQSNYNELMSMLQNNAAAARAAQGGSGEGGDGGAAATPAAPTTAATPAAPQQNRSTAPPSSAAGAPAASGAAPAAPITQAALASMLQGVLSNARTAEGDAATLPAVFSQDELLHAVRRHQPEIERLLQPHLAPTQPPDSVEATLMSPQLRQAVEQLAAALASGSAEQIFAELNLQPRAPGTLGFIQAMQEQADAARAGAPAAEGDGGNDAMDTS